VSSENGDVKIKMIMMMVIQTTTITTTTTQPSGVVFKPNF